MRVHVPSHINFKLDPLNSGVLFVQARPEYISQM